MKAVSLAPDTARFGSGMPRIGISAAKRWSAAEGGKVVSLATSEAGLPRVDLVLTRCKHCYGMETYGLAKTCLDAALKSDDVVIE